MVYILSRIVDKFFFRRTVFSINEHPDFTLLRPDHHRLTAHAAHHVKGIHWPTAKGQLQGILLDPLFDRLPKLVGDLEEPVRRTKPPDALMGPFVVVVLDPQRGALYRLLEAVKLRPLQKLPQDRLPEPLDLTERHRVVRPGADVFNPVLLQLLLKPGLPPPVGVLPAVVGQHLFGNPVLGHRPPVGLQHVLGGLAAVQPQGRHVAAVIVDEADQVGVVASQPDSQNVALPELVRPGPLKKTRLGRVLLRLDWHLLHQPPFGKGLMDGRGTGAHQKKAFQNIADPPGTVLRMLRFDGYRLLPNLLGYPALTGDGTLGLQPRSSMKPKGSHPALNRMGADPKLLNQQLGIVPLFQVKLYNPQPELHRKSNRSALALRPACGALGCACHRMTSSLCKWFFTLGSVTQFPQIRVIKNWRLGQP
jgi:hypothetical protein